jgi:RNA recognition motif-containing protein
LTFKFYCGKLFKIGAGYIKGLIVKFFFGVCFVNTNKLYVGNLNYQTTEEKLKEVFSGYGSVVSVKVIEGKGFGFVEMESKDDAQKAKDALDNTDLDGRNIRVDEAKPRESNPRPRSNYSNSRNRF